MGLISIDYACAVYTTVGSAILIPDFGTRVRSKKKKKKKKKYIYKLLCNNIKKNVLVRSPLKSPTSLCGVFSGPRFGWR